MMKNKFERVREMAIERGWDDAVYWDYEKVQRYARFVLAKDEHGFDENNIHPDVRPGFDEFCLARAEREIAAEWRAEGKALPGEIAAVIGEVLSEFSNTRVPVMGGEVMAMAQGAANGFSGGFVSVMDRPEVVNAITERLRKRFPGEDIDKFLGLTSAGTT